MSRPSKGDRVVFTCRLPRPIVDALHAYKVQEGLDGVPAVIEEWAALRGDRDEELLTARRRAVEAEARADALQGVANQALRDARHWKKAAGKRRSRADAKRHVPQIVLSDEEIERAARTPCPKGCGSMMDPLGLRAGLPCPPCRRAPPKP